MKLKKTLYKLWSRFLTMFGNIKIFRFPFFFVYDPDEPEVTGEKTLEIMSILKPGDVILRGYTNYLDGKFVPSALKFSHAGLYVGGNKIVHAIAEGVSETNVIEFTRCDRIAIVRPKAKKHVKDAAIAKAFEMLKNKTPYDFGFERGASAVYCFELCGEAYDTLNIPRHTVKKFFGLVKKAHVFLAESFFESPDFECVFQWNPKFKIDFKK